MKRSLYWMKGLFASSGDAAAVLPPWDKTAVVGSPLPRVDAYERVSGTAEYPSDVVLPNMLYGAILRCPHPHARVKKVDVSRAERLPGVRAVIHDALPDAKIPWHFEDKGPASRLFDPHARHEGDEVAAVAAETPYAAWDAVRAIAVDYEPLPFVVDERRAAAPGAPEVRDGGNKAGPPEEYARGDLARGFAEADAIVERTFHSECLIHAPMEPHGCVARWDGDRLTLWESTQGVYPVQRTVARAFDLPLTQVRVIGHYMGGGFGSKLDTGKYSAIAAILARRTGQPVKLFLTREETFLVMGNRPPSVMKLKAGARKDGTLTALEFDGLGSGGAFSDGGTSILDWQVRDLYLCPNVRTVSQPVFTHTGTERPMRAPGHPQCSWALEQLLDELADRLGLDPLDLRLKNLPSVSQARGGIPYTSTGLRACLVEGARAFGWKEARAGSRGNGPKVRGAGMAGALWIGGGGGPPSTAIVRVSGDGSVNLNMGASDIGTGTKTVMAMVVAEELGVRPEQVQIEHADTGTTQFATASGGSKTVPTESPAVRAAAAECRTQILEMASRHLGIPLSDLTLRDGSAVSTKDPAKKAALREMPEFRERQVVIGVGRRGRNPEGKAISAFAAQFCEVEVDTLTGEVRVLRFAAAHDSGRAMNLKTYETQVHGGITMGIGFGATERRVLDAGQTGRMLNANLHDYKLPTALDVPTDVKVVPIDPRDLECNSTGAKGLGEPATIPTAAAVANAVYHATGVRFADSPINATRLSEMLAARKSARERRG